MAHRRGDLVRRRRADHVPGQPPSSPAWPRRSCSGNLADKVQARIGLVVALSGAAIIVYNDPDHSTGDLVFTPSLFAIAWLAGYALRERAEQAEAAEQRATQAEREREAAARIAVAEERARIARELHDIVAHSVSVMVLQVGAVRHKLPAELDRGRGGASIASSRPAARRSPRCGGCSARCTTATTLELAPQPGLDDLDALVEKVRLAGLPGARSTSRATRSRSRARSTSPRTGSSRRA